MKHFYNLSFQNILKFINKAKYQSHHHLFFLTSINQNVNIRCTSNYWTSHSFCSIYTIL